MEKVKQLKNEWDIKNPTGLPEQFISYVLSKPDSHSKDVIWYVSRRLTEPFVVSKGPYGRRTLMIDEKYRLNSPGVQKAQGLLNLIDRPGFNGITTTNYDLLVELSLGMNGFNYGKKGEELFIGANPFPGAKVQKAMLGNIPLAKLHGSISWDSRLRYGDCRCGLNGRALIVPPSPEKKAINELKDQWETASTLLKKSQGLIFFGFSFNPNDSAVLDLLKECGSDLSNILVIDPFIDEMRVKKIWPHCEIIFAKPPPEGSSTIASWLSKTIR